MITSKTRTPPKKTGKRGLTLGTTTSGRPMPEEIENRFGLTIRRAASLGVSMALCKLIEKSDRIAIARAHVYETLASLNVSDSYIWSMCANAIKNHSRKLLKQVEVPNPEPPDLRTTETVPTYRIREGQAKEVHDEDGSVMGHDDALDHQKANYGKASWLNINRHRSWMNNPEEWAATVERIEQGDRLLDVTLRRIDRLTPEDSRLLLGEATDAELAAELGISEEAVRSRRARAKKRLFFICGK